MRTALAFSLAANLVLTMAILHLEKEAVAVKRLDQFRFDQISSVTARKGILDPIDGPLPGFFAKAHAQSHQALANAFRTNPKRGDLYRAAALLLLAKDRAGQAWKVLDQAVKNIPEDPQLRVMKAIAAALVGMADTGEFQQIENRWPEWSQAWVAHALVLEADGQPQQAQRDLDTAKALGAAGAAVDTCAAEIKTSGALGKAERRSRLLRAITLLFP